MKRKIDKKRQLNSRTLVLGILLIVIAVSFKWIDSSSTTPVRYVQSSADELLKVNIPSDIPSTPLNYAGMNISFNPKMHIPNYVAWELTADEATGTEPRWNKFAADDSVAGCAESYDYNYTGYDRGHMAPAGDMKWDAEAMRQTFYMTNICPQAKSLNTGAWKNLEEKCRTWAKVDSAIMIVCGPVINDNITEFIGDSKVAVPKRFFKVVLSPFANPPRGIGFVMPNSKVKGGMQATAMSIDEVEAITGYDFFSALPDDIENEVESQNDFHLWSTLR